MEFFISSVFLMNGRYEGVFVQYVSEDANFFRVLFMIGYIVSVVSTEICEVLGGIIIK